MMHNLAQIRQDGLDQVMLKDLNTTRRLWVEQDCINKYCRGRVKVLGSEWNACQYTRECGQPKIRHFAYDPEYTWMQLPEVIRYAEMPWEECVQGRE